MMMFGDSARRFIGPAGTSFCGDGYGLHRAVVPRTRPRLLLWMRFGTLFNNTKFNMDPGTGDRRAMDCARRRIPATPRHQYVFRYLVDALSPA
jgi:hypothetical protein